LRRMTTKEWIYKTPGIPDEAFTQSDEVPGPTKEEIRVITISKARLRDGAVVIDIGCGTGGLTVEAALQVAPSGKVYAIDENPEAIELTKTNVAKFDLQKTVQVIDGKAVEALIGLPQVDAVIFGGSHALRETLRAAHGKLRAGGRIVLNAILLETATAALDELKNLGFKELEVLEIFVAKGKTLEAGTMMLARNPIIIVSAIKE